MFDCFSTFAELSIHTTFKMGFDLSLIIIVVKNNRGTICTGEKYFLLKETLIYMSMSCSCCKLNNVNLFLFLRFLLFFSKPPSAKEGGG
jgi:hypothetical protein